MECPKCHHIRQRNDIADPGQCPNCGVIYTKYDAKVDMRREELRKISERRLYRAAVAESTRVNAREAAVIREAEAARMREAMNEAALKNGPMALPMFRMFGIFVGSLLAVGALMFVMMIPPARTSNTLAIGHRAVLDRLKDPDSAQFRGERMGRLGVCGEVNSKNGFGGYAGYQRFIATAGFAVLEREMESAEFARAWAEAC